jgi:regulator of sigma E protease
MLARLVHTTAVVQPFRNRFVSERRQWVGRLAAPTPMSAGNPQGGSKMEGVPVLLFLPLCLAACVPHELGHLVAARALKVPVLELGVGLPPRACAVRWAGLAWSLNAVPLGAFIRYAGEPGCADPAAYTNRSPGQRAILAVAGAAGNVAAGVLFLALAVALAGVPPADLPGSVAAGIWEAMVGLVAPPPNVGFSLLRAIELISLPPGVPDSARWLGALASLSFALGVVNLLPLPPLDGAKAARAALLALRGARSVP